MTDDIASGFQSVDSASDFGVFASCLTLIDSLPLFAECKRESYDLLGATPGRRVLEVGCGLGDDAASLARLVAPGGSVVAIDGSETMIEAARERHRDVAGLSFDVADAAQLPFDDASFDACRIDRVLQHIANPAPAVLEMVRVIQPGGVLVRTTTIGRLGPSRDDAHRPERLVRPIPLGLDWSAAGSAVSSGRSS